MVFQKKINAVELIVGENNLAPLLAIARTIGDTQPGDSWHTFTAAKFEAINEDNNTHLFSHPLEVKGGGIVFNESDNIKPPHNKGLLYYNDGTIYFTYDGGDTWTLAGDSWISPGRWTDITTGSGGIRYNEGMVVIGDTWGDADSFVFYAKGNAKFLGDSNYFLKHVIFGDSSYVYFGDSVVFNGITTFGDSVYFSSKVYFGDSVEFNGNIVFGDTVVFNSDLVIGGETNFNYYTYFGDSVDFISIVRFGDSVAFNDMVSFGDSVDFTSIARFTGMVNFGDSVTFGDTTFFDSSVIINDAAKDAFGWGRADEVKEPNGFVNTTSSTLSWSDVTYTLTITPISEFVYYHNGIRYAVSSPDTVQIDDTEEGIHWIYYDGDVLTSSPIATAPEENELMRDYVLVAIVYWDATNGTGIVANERHGCAMSWSTHYNLHGAEGSRYIEGLALGDFTSDDSGDIDSHAQFTSTTGEILDEDLPSTPEAKTLTGEITVLYRLGVNGYWRWDTSSAGVLAAPSGRAYWNEFDGDSWFLSEVTNNAHVVAHVFASNNIDAGLIVIMGQAEYTLKKDAQDGVVNEISSIVTSGLPMAEYVYIGAILYKTSDSYSNTWQSAVQSVDGGGDYIDFRTSKISSGHAGVQDHGSLSGLSDPDHAVTAISFTNSNRVLGRQTGGTGAGQELAFRVPYTYTITASYTILDTDTITRIISRTTEAGDSNDINMPTASANVDREITIIQAGDTYQTLIQFEAGDSMNGIYDQIFLNKTGQKVTMFSDGTYWWKIDGEPSYMTGHLSLGGGHYIIPVDLRRPTWDIIGLNDVNPVSFEFGPGDSNLIPLGVKAIEMYSLVRYTGDDTTDGISLYSRPTGSSATDTTQTRIGNYYYTNLGNTLVAGSSYSINLECNFAGSVDIWCSQSTGSNYFKVIGYSMGI